MKNTIKKIISMVLATMMLFSIRITLVAEKGDRYIGYESAWSDASIGDKTEEYDDTAIFYWASPEEICFICTDFERLVLCGFAIVSMLYPSDKCFSISFRIIFSLTLKYKFPHISISQLHTVTVTMSRKVIVRRCTRSRDDFEEISIVKEEDSE